MTPEHEVTGIDAAAHEAVAGALARAFFDDPLMTYVQPDPERRRRDFPWFFNVAVRYIRRHGRADTFAGSRHGAALWLPPERPIASFFDMVRAGILATPFRLGPGPALRLMRVANFLEPFHRHEVPPQHWYLMTLGIDPAEQGRGYGGAIIAPVLERADREGLHCYLETMTERNVTFYRKHGFEVAAEGELPGGAPYFWTMRRPPIG